MHPVVLAKDWSGYDSESMNTKLQELTQSLYEEGVEKARTEGRKLVAQAEARAAEVLAAARAEAAEVLAQAKVDADLERSRMRTELAQAADHAMAKFRQELGEALERNALDAALGDGFRDPAYLLDLLKTLVGTWGLNGGGDLVALFPKAEQVRMESWFAAKAKDLFDRGLTLRFDGGFANGFRIGPADGSYQVSFTEEDALRLFQAYLKTRTRELLFPLA